MARFPAAGAALALALTTAGCSFSYQLDSMFAKDGVRTAAERTGSIRANSVNAVAVPRDGDLDAARAAVAEVLAKGGKDVSMPWENPSTGARGTITPLASAYTQGGTTCRDFLASYVRNGNESWLQGEACRGHQGRWEVRHMKPWRRT